jgi:CDP-glycerol glycerophosphotransferase (TagB/SpsB family)
MGIKSILKVLSKPLTPLNSVIPKRKDSIFIYSNLGFRDNVKSLYDYLIAHHYNDRYTIVCSLDDYKSYLDSVPNNVKFVSNLSGLRYFLTSRYAFYSFGKYPIKPSSKQVVVNLWHGMPLKTVGNLERGFEDVDYNYFTYTIATSPMFRDVMSRSFNCPLDNVLLTGQPRCDVLVDSKVPPEKTILWLPTYRNSDRLGSNNSQLSHGFDFPLVENTSQLDTLNTLLRSLGYTLIIKPHPMQNVTMSLESYSNIKVQTQQDCDRQHVTIYDMFMRSSALVTDYSSVYFDYLLLDRPIAFTMDDFTQYSDSRGFSVPNPESLMAGVKVYDFNGLLEYIKSVANGVDNFSSERARVNALVNSHQSACASKTILNYVGIVK